jgi:hypothetical protein
MTMTITTADVIRVYGADDETASGLADMLGLSETHDGDPDLTLDYTWTCGAELRTYDAQVFGWLVSEDYLLVCLSSHEAGREAWTLISVEGMDTSDIEDAVREFAEESGDGPSGNGTVVTGDFRYVASVFADMEPA